MSARALTLVTADDVIARLDALLGEVTTPRDTLLAFDADGTLWSGDVGIDGFEALLDKNAVLPAAADALHEEARMAGLPLAESATEQAKVLYDAFKRDAYHEGRAFRMMAFAFAGYREEEVRMFAADVARARSLTERLHPEIAPIVAWGARNGGPVYVVSASHSTVVQASLDFLALPIDGVFAMTQAKDGDIFAPSVVEPATYAEGKTAALTAGLPGKTLLAAFGDSAFDLHLLCAARLAVAVRPKAALRERAAECAGLVELAVAVS
jgi:phosphoserine phosphatase